MMLNHRGRILTFLVIFSLLISLIPSGLPLSSANAEDVYGITTAPGVRVRKQASTSADIWFQIPQGYVCLISGETNAEGIHWYKVVAVHPEPLNTRTYLGYIHGDYFRPLTEAEAAQYLASGSQTPGTTSAPYAAPSASGISDNVPAAAGTTGSITNGGVNFREEPSLRGRSMEKLNRGDQVEVLSIPPLIDVEHWYQVRYKGTVGYIQSLFLIVTIGGATVSTPTPEQGTVITATPAPVVITATPAPAATDEGYGFVQLILSSCHLRTQPDGYYDIDKDWLGKGSMLPLTGKAVQKAGYIWYPVRKDGKVYYVRNDCVQIVGEAAPTVTPGPTATAAPATAVPVVTATPAPETGTTTVGHVRTIASGCNLRSTPGGSVITQIDNGVTLLFLQTPVQQDGYTWYYVDYNGVKGYLRSDVVTVLDTVVTTGSPYTTATPAPATAVPAVTATPAPETVITVGHVQTIMTGCNLRSTPGGSVIRQIGKGVTLPFLLKPVKKDGYTWYYVDANGTRGYLRNDVVKVLDTSETTPTPAVPSVTATPDPGIVGYVVTTANDVNLRQKAGYTPIIGKVKKGIVLPYYSTSTANNVLWYKVKDTSLGIGWLHGSYVSVVNADGSATPSPEPTATPAGTTPGPSSQQEASYTTLRPGSSGNAVKNLVTELKNQGYYTGEITSSYTSAVERAVRKFQEAKGLTVDGIAGSATQHKLYNTVPVGAADSSNLTMTLYAAEKIDWWTGGINEMWAKGSNYKVFDVKTGIVFWAHRWSGGYHIDAEPLTAADTARFCKMYGVTTSQEIKDKDLYQRRPCLVTIGTRTFACSIFGEPHNYPDGDTIPDNEFKGQFCIHFTNSWTHNSRKVDSGHEAAITYAWEHAPNGHK